MLVSPAYAQAAGAAPQGGGLEAFIPLILIFVVFYFFIIRPQSKKMKDHKAMLSAVRRGDKVVTGGGILATVTKIVDDTTLQVEIAEGIRVKVRRDTIAAVDSKTEPVKDAKDEGPKPSADDPNASAGARLKGLLGGGKKDD